MSKVMLLSGLRGRGLGAEVVRTNPSTTIEKHNVRQWNAMTVDFLTRLSGSWLGQQPAPIKRIVCDPTPVSARAMDMMLAWAVQSALGNLLQQQGMSLQPGTRYALSEAEINQVLGNAKQVFAERIAREDPGNAVVIIDGQVVVRPANCELTL
jgi:hypothetical protein